MYPAPRIAAASSSLTRPGANFLRDGVASFGHHGARPIRSLFTSPGPLANTQDAEAARTLAATNNRYAAYHCQQAAEKLMKAVLLHRGIESGTEHRLDMLVDELPEGDPWKAKLRLLETYSPYATTYRYPTPGGRIVAAPDMAQVEVDANAIEALIKEARVGLQ
jgi:HEPN domain-containing protein